VRRRIWVRAAAIAVVLVGLIAGLTVYFSSEAVPPCGVSDAPRWTPPKDREPHRFMVVFPDRAACFFALDNQQQLVGALELPEARDPSFAAPLQDDVAVRTASGPYTLDLRSGRFTKEGVVPFATDTLNEVDLEHQVMYVTQRGLLGFRVLDLPTGRTLYVVHYAGFTWNRSFGPDPPSHGLALAPDRPELWVLDAPNRTLHVFDVSGLPGQPPRRVEDVRLERTLTGPGSLAQSADGRFIYVGGAGEVVDTRTRRLVAELDALKDATALLEVDWVDGRPVFPGFPR
jgi:hypothetical protein